MNSNVMPEAFLASNKNRLPIYSGNRVYLKDGSEFELELFNPTTKTVGLKISVNGTQMGSMLVMRPGMRYFLDRHLDEAKKLAYSTYLADDSAAGRAATALNGIVEVSFYREVEPTLTFSIPFIVPTVPWYPYYGGGGTYYCNTDSLGGTSCDTSSIGTTVTTNNLSYNTSASSQTFNFGGSMNQPLFETGRVEKGSTSGQHFDNYSGTFETYSFHTVKWQISPESVRPKDLRKYCECGKRQKATHRFCPKCGRAV